MAAHPPPVTEDALIQHRLKELEEFATGARQVERDVDTMKIALNRLEQSITEIQTEMRSNSEQTAKSLARLHERLDQTLREQAREEGREQGRAEVRAQAVEEGRAAGKAEGKDEARRTTWKVVGFTVMAMIPFCALVILTLNFALN